MDITKRRQVFKPFEYPEAADYWLKQNQAHWLHSEISMASDIADWKGKLNDVERSIIGNTLKGFIQAEIVIGDYWTRRVQKYFPKPEICMMASSFGAMEQIHTQAYAYLNESLGLEDYDAFLYDESAKAKLNNFIETPNKTKKDTALSLATFSGFAEGVSLFSSFCILLSFATRNLMKGLGQIIAFSQKDEDLHSTGGCWLFRTFMKENPELLKEVQEDVYEAARTVVKLEDDFIDMVFELGSLPLVTPDLLKNYIRMRANVKLQELGLRRNWRNIDAGMLKDMDWFINLGSGVEHADFFATRVTTYAKGTMNWERIWG